MAANVVKCRYKYCKHPDEPLLKENAVKSGNAYYHSDCLKERDKLNEIFQYYLDNFEKDPIMSLLRKTINNLVFQRKYSPDYVLFALKYTKLNNIPLNHPAGMYYVMKNYKIADAWDRVQRQKKQTQIDKVEFKADSVLGKVDGYGTNKADGFGRVLHR